MYALLRLVVTGRIRFGIAAGRLGAGRHVIGVEHAATSKETYGKQGCEKLFHDEAFLEVGRGASSGQTITGPAPLLQLARKPLRNIFRAERRLSGWPTSSICHTRTPLPARPRGERHFSANVSRAVP